MEVHYSNQGAKIQRHGSVSFVDCTVRNFLICLMLYSPRKALLQILPILNIHSHMSIEPGPKVPDAF